MTPKSKRSPNRKKLYQIAEQQAGYFTSEQALAAGFTQPLLSYYAHTGQFARIKRGIYRLTQFPEMPFADLFVAWLQMGKDSVISHDSALVVYGLSDVLPGEIHVTMPRTASRRREDIRLHTNRLTADEITRRAGLPITTVPRTIADVIASGLGEEQVHQAIREAIERGLVTEKTLASYATRRGGRVARVVSRALKQEQIA
jgi:predicted transcriptional regulator of viral defense system